MSLIKVYDSIFGNDVGTFKNSKLIIPTIGLFISTLLVSKMFCNRKLIINPNTNVVFITGCDTGFGYLLSKHLKSKGYVVISACLTEAGVNELKLIVDLAILCDITKQSEIDNTYAIAEKYIQNNNLHLWAIVNNAGISKAGQFDWLDISDYEKCFNVNYFGMLRVTKAFLPLLKYTSSSRIINLSSVAAIFGRPNASAYCGKNNIDF